MIANRLLAALASVGVLGLAAVPASAQVYDRITFENSTGYTISEIYLSPADTADWEEDVLGRRELFNGKEYWIDFNDAENTCEWDLRVVYKDGEEAIWSDLNLCRDWHFELFYDPRTGNTWLTPSH
jgi:hypothetical protein